MVSCGEEARGEGSLTLGAILLTISEMLGGAGCFLPRFPGDQQDSLLL